MNKPPIANFQQIICIFFQLVLSQQNTKNRVEKCNWNRTERNSFVRVNSLNDEVNETGEIIRVANADSQDEGHKKQTKSPNLWGVGVMWPKIPIYQNTAEPRVVGVAYLGVFTTCKKKIKLSD